ncbi:MAG TPA: PKD domain-containing protein, partial [Desulfobacterales bacterium]|nr:PKD domain-containing protein [Desulfobacterales bacterium]
TTTYAGRVDWCNYLDSIATAGPAEIAGGPAHVATVGSSAAFSADTTGHSPGTMYVWDMGDGTIIGSMSPPTDGGSTVNHTYTVANSFNITLYVVAPTGTDWKTDTETVHVGALGATYSAAVTQLDDPDEDPDVYPFLYELALGVPNAMPAHDGIFVVWGDGTRNLGGTTATTLDIEHEYRANGQMRINPPGTDPEFLAVTDIRLWDWINPYNHSWGRRQVDATKRLEVYFNGDGSINSVVEP